MSRDEIDRETEAFQALEDFEGFMEQAIEYAWYARGLRGWLEGDARTKATKELAFYLTRVFLSRSQGRIGMVPSAYGIQDGGPEDGKLLDSWPGDRKTKHPELTALSARTPIGREP